MADTFDKWARASGVYYHLSQRDGDWTTEQALQACWKAAQAASAAALAERDKVLAEAREVVSMMASDRLRDSARIAIASPLLARIDALTQGAAK